MTKRIVNRPLFKNGRKPMQPPSDAAARIEAFAADGFSVRGVAAGLGVCQDTMKKWFDEFPELQEAFDVGRERERQALHNMLYRQAIEKGVTVAAIFLLKSRHNYRDQGDQYEGGNKIQINFQLPGALPMEEFSKLTRVIEHGKPNDRDERISEQRPLITRGT